MNKEDLYAKFNVTDEQLDEWVEEYESDDWSNMEFGLPIKGLPNMKNDELEVITIKVPRSSIRAIDLARKDSRVSRSEFICKAIDKEIMSLAK